MQGWQRLIEERGIGYDAMEIAGRELKGENKDRIVEVQTLLFEDGGVVVDEREEEGGRDSRLEGRKS